MTVRLKPQLPLTLRAILEPEMPYRIDIQGRVWTPIAYLALHHYVDMLLSDDLFRRAHRDPIRVMRRRWVWSRWHCVMSLEGHVAVAKPEWEGRHAN
jgi:hypothetical protein